METSPEVGILQHCNGTFLAGTDYFERGIAFFTQIVNCAYGHLLVTEAS